MREGACIPQIRAAVCIGRSYGATLDVQPLATPLVHASAASGRQRGISNRHGERRERGIRVPHPDPLIHISLFQPRSDSETPLQHVDTQTLCAHDSFIHTALCMNVVYERVNYSHRWIRLLERCAFRLQTLRYRHVLSYDIKLPPILSPGVMCQVITHHFTRRYDQSFIPLGGNSHW